MGINARARVAAPDTLADNSSPLMSRLAAVSYLQCLVFDGDRMKLPGTGGNYMNIAYACGTCPCLVYKDTRNRRKRAQDVKQIVGGQRNLLFFYAPLA